MVPSCWGTCPRVFRLGYTTDISVNTFDIRYLSIFSIGDTICSRLQHELRATPEPQLLVLQQFAAIAQQVQSG